MKKENESEGDDDEEELKQEDRLVSKQGKCDVLVCLLSDKKCFV
jgi:hypothetical protein